jgi:hypothetical protein
MKLGQATKKSKKIKVSKIDGTFVAVYDGYSNAARATGVKVQNIYKTCSGYKTSLNGYNFEITNEEN